MIEDKIKTIIAKYKLEEVTLDTATEELKLLFRNELSKGMTTSWNQCYMYAGLTKREEFIEKYIEKKGL